MRCPCGFLCLLAIPLVLGGGAPAEPTPLKDLLQVVVRADSGTAQRFEVKTAGFRVMFRRPRDAAMPIAVNDTMWVVGSGTLDIVSTDPGKSLAVDAWMLSAESSTAVRYTGRVVKVERASTMSPYFVTTP